MLWSRLRDKLKINTIYKSIDNHIYHLILRILNTPVHTKYVLYHCLSFIIPNVNSLWIMKRIMNISCYFFFYKNQVKVNKQGISKKMYEQTTWENLYLQYMLYSIRKIFSLTEIVNGRMSVYVARYVRHHIFQD